MTNEESIREFPRYMPELFINFLETMTDEEYVNCGGVQGLYERFAKVNWRAYEAYKEEYGD